MVHFPQIVCYSVRQSYDVFSFIYTLLETCQPLWLLLLIFKYPICLCLFQAKHCWGSLTHKMHAVPFWIWYKVGKVGSCGNEP